MPRLAVALLVALGSLGCTFEEESEQQIEVGAGDIYSIAPDGSDLRRLTKTNDHDEGWLAPSPDGKRIAFFRDDRELVVADVDGKNEVELGPVRLTVDFRRPPAWSPDSRQVAWAQGVNCGEVICDDQEVWVADVVTQTRRKVADVAVDPTWSPDGRLLAWTHARLVVDREPVYHLSVVVALVDGSARRVLTRGFQSPSFSPDGKLVAFVGHEVSPYGLFVATVDGRARRKVATLPSAPLAWSPDGRWIAGSDDAGDGAVVARVSDGRTRHLGDTNYLVPFIEGSAWSPDGRLAWSRGRRIFMATPDGRGRRAITLEPANAVAGGVAWSRDGNRIFFSA